MKYYYLTRYTYIYIYYYLLYSHSLITTKSYPFRKSEFNQFNPYILEWLSGNRWGGLIGRDNDFADWQQRLRCLARVISIWRIVITMQQPCSFQMTRMPRLQCDFEGGIHMERWDRHRNIHVWISFVFHMEIPSKGWRSIGNPSLHTDWMAEHGWTNSRLSRWLKPNFPVGYWFGP